MQPHHPRVRSSNTASPLLPCPESPSFSTLTCCLRDIDGDGDLDAYCTAPPGTTAIGGARVLRNAGTGRLEPVPSMDGLGSLTDGSGYTSAFLDFDGDGDLDLLVVDTTLQLIENNGTGFFTVKTDSAISDAGGSFSMLVADFSGDGLVDLILGHGAMTVSAYQGLNSG